MKAALAKLDERVSRLEQARVVAEVQPVTGQRAAAFVSAQQTRGAVPAKPVAAIQVAMLPPLPVQNVQATPRVAAWPPSTGASAEPEKPEKRGINFEQMLAGRWYAALGALAVVIAVSLFVKLAYDQGWLRVSPVWRCVGAGMFGIVMVGVAEWIRKRWGEWAACGTASAGLGAIYASVFAAYKLYGLMSPGAAIVMMLVVAIAGTVVGVRLRLGLVIAVSLLGGYLAPILMRGADASMFALPGYVLALMCVGLASCTWLEHKHAIKSTAGVRGLAVGGATLLISLWTFNTASLSLWAGLSVLTLTWLLVHADAVINAMLAKQSSEAHEDDVLSRELKTRGASLVLATLAVTVWAVALSMHMIATNRGAAMWLPALAACAMSGLLAGVLAPFGASISKLPATLRHVVGQSLLAQAALLLVVVIAAALGGYAQVAAFAGMGLAAAVMGPRLSSRAMRWYGIWMLSLGTLRLIFVDTFFARAGVAEFQIGGLVLTWSSLALTLIAGVWTAAMTATNDQQPSRTKGVLRACVPAALLMLVPLDEQARAMSMLWVWIAIASVLSQVRMLRAVRFEIAALLVFAVCAAAWALLATNRMAGAAFTATSPVQLAFAGLTIAAGALIIAMRERTLDLVVRSGVIWSSAVLGLLASSVGVSAIVEAIFAMQTSTRGAVSVWWAIVAVAALAAGFRWAKPTVRYAGLALLGIAGAKVVIYDLSEVSPVWRIATFLVVGLIMMGVAFVYGSLSRQSGAVKR